MSDDHSSERVVKIALLSNFSVTVVKFIGWIFTSSPSLLAEAMHSLADTFNQCLLLIGVRTSQAPNKGSMQFLFNFTSALGVFVLGGIATIYHAIHDIFEPAPIQTSNNLFYLGVGIIIFSFIVEGYSCIAAVRQVYKQKGNRSLISFLSESDDTTLVGIFLEDSAALLGLVIALIGMITSKVTGSNIPDIVAAITIGLMMGFIAIVLTINNSRLLIGKSLSDERMKEISDMIESTLLVDKVKIITTEIIGTNKVNLYCSVEINGSALITNAEVIEDIAEIKEDLNDGETIAPIIVDMCDRTVRKLGLKIQELELEIKKEFPEIHSIDLEVS